VLARGRDVQSVLKRARTSRGTIGSDNPNRRSGTDGSTTPM
jgi:hypothetical protein